MLSMIREMRTSKNESESESSDSLEVVGMEKSDSSRNSRRGV